MRWLVLSAIFLLGLVAALKLLDRPRASPTAIFLIVVDTLRPDRVSSYSYEFAHTPNIDRLAAIGTQFDTARAVASWTTPSMGAMLTSLYPSQLGLIETALGASEHIGGQELRAQLAWTLPPGARTMAERLHGAGLRTAAFVDQPALNDLGGFLQGFDHWFTPDASGEIVRLRRSDPPAEQHWDGSGEQSLRIDRDLAGHFDTWLAEGAGQPTFAWLHLLTPHLPYVSRLTSERPSAGSPAERYAAEVRAVDSVVGEILDSIDRHVGLERAHVFFTSDHGEALGEHGMYHHGNTLHSEVTRVPLIIASPSMRRGARVAAAARTIDILPTMLEIAGLEQLESDALEGQSLLPPFGEGDEDGDGASAGRDTYAEGMLYGPSEHSLVSGGFKLLYDSGRNRYSLYDTRRDLGEEEDLAHTQPERVKRMREALEAHTERLEASAIQRESSGDRNSIPESVEAALRALGYAE